MAAQVGRLSAETLVAPTGSSRKVGRGSTEVLVAPSDISRKVGRGSTEVLVRSVAAPAATVFIGWGVPT